MMAIISKPKKFAFLGAFTNLVVDDWIFSRRNEIISKKENSIEAVVLGGYVGGRKQI